MILNFCVSVSIVSVCGLFCGCSPALQHKKATTMVTPPHPGFHWPSVHRTKIAQLPLSVSSIRTAETSIATTSTTKIRTSPINQLETVTTKARANTTKTTTRSSSLLILPKTLSSSSTQPDTKETSTPIPNEIEISTKTFPNTPSAVSQFDMDVTFDTESNTTPNSPNGQLPIHIRWISTTSGTYVPHFYTNSSDSTDRTNGGKETDRIGKPLIIVSCSISILAAFIFMLVIICKKRLKRNGRVDVQL